MHRLKIILFIAFLINMIGIVSATISYDTYTWTQRQEPTDIEKYINVKFEKVTDYNQRIILETDIKFLDDVQKSSIYNYEDCKLSKSIDCITKDNLINKDKFPIKYYYEVCDDITLQCELFEDKLRQPLIKSFDITKKNNLPIEWAPGLIIKIGFNSITYASVTNTLTFTGGCDAENEINYTQFYEKDLEDGTLNWTVIINNKHPSSPIQDFYFNISNVECGDGVTKTCFWDYAKSIGFPIESIHNLNKYCNFTLGKVVNQDLKTSALGINFRLVGNKTATQIFFDGDQGSHFQFYSTTFATEPGTGTWQRYMTQMEDGIVWNTYFDNRMFFNNPVGIQFYNTQFTTTNGVNYGIVTPINVTLQDVKFTGFNYALYMFNPSKDTNITNLFVRNGTLAYLSCNPCTIKYTKVGLLDPNIDNPQITWVLNANHTVTIFNSVNIITRNSTQPMGGVQVNCKDKNDVTYIDATTFDNGTLPLKYLPSKRYENFTKMTEITNNPYNCTFNKTSFGTVSYNINFTQPGQYIDAFMQEQIINTPTESNCTNTTLINNTNVFNAIAIKKSSAISIKFS